MSIILMLIIIGLSIVIACFVYSQLKSGIVVNHKPIFVTILLATGLIYVVFGCIGFAENIDTLSTPQWFNTFGTFATLVGYGVIVMGFGETIYNQK